MREHHPVLKVKRAELMRAIGGRIRELNEKYQKEKEKYPVELEAFCESAAAQLEKLAARLRKGDVAGIEHSYNGSTEFKV